MEKQIFKVQISLNTHDKEQTALIYNKDKSIMLELPLDEPIKKLMEGSYKEFVYGNFSKSSKKKRSVTLLNIAPWQKGW